MYQETNHVIRKIWEDPLPTHNPYAGHLHAKSPDGKTQRNPVGKVNASPERPLKEAFTQKFSQDYEERNPGAVFMEPMMRRQNLGLGALEEEESHLLTFTRATSSGSSTQLGVRGVDREEPPLMEKLVVLKGAPS